MGKARSDATPAAKKPQEPLEARTPALRNARYKVQVELDAASELLATLTLDTRIPLCPPEGARAAMRKVFEHLEAASTILKDDVGTELERLLDEAQAAEDGRLVTVELTHVDVERLHVLAQQIVDASPPDAAPRRGIEHRGRWTSHATVMNPVLHALRKALAL